MAIKPLCIPALLHHGQTVYLEPTGQENPEDHLVSFKAIVEIPDNSLLKVREYEKDPTFYTTRYQALKAEDIALPVIKTTIPQGKANQETMLKALVFLLSSFEKNGTDVSLEKCISTLGPIFDVEKEAFFSYVGGPNPQEAPDKLITYCRDNLPSVDFTTQQQIEQVSCRMQERGSTLTYQIKHSNVYTHMYLDGSKKKIQCVALVALSDQYQGALSQLGIETTPIGKAPAFHFKEETFIWILDHPLVKTSQEMSDALQSILRSIQENFAPSDDRYEALGYEYAAQRMIEKGDCTYAEAEKIWCLVKIQNFLEYHLPFSWNDREQYRTTQKIEDVLSLAKILDIPLKAFYSVLSKAHSASMGNGWDKVQDKLKAPV